ncbi:hypothetical protein NM208_g8102 [Fusarium decemcellulare]|uniref:Uncharacterized protein n=1 Tax=Fusarium decemcellulare TaxID=57161 RepID=A0ACC1S6S8_9HYPO|nr:hypothetical protein NM208_g8102 [Fusarium decemcellulare]
MSSSTNESNGPKWTLGKRNNTYYLSAKPAEPVRRSAQCFTPDDQEHNESSSFQLGAGEYQLEKLISTSRATTYTTKIGDESYAVKLGGSPDSVMTAFLLHNLIFDTFNKFWLDACPDLSDEDEDEDDDDDNDDGIIPPAFLTEACSMIAVLNNSTGKNNIPAGYMMECIPPLPADHAQALVSKFISPSVAEDPNLSRLRLQVHMSELSPENQDQNTNLLFRPVYFDELWHEGEELNFAWAMSMGVTLAILHWGCGVDARGVKFLLAPGPMDCCSTIQLWITSFDDVAPFELGPTTVQSLVDAVISNPAWPRPDFGQSIMELVWECFYNNYLRVSHKIMLQEGMNPRVADEFIFELALAWRLRPAPGRAQTHTP